MSAVLEAAITVATAIVIIGWIFGGVALGFSVHDRLESKDASARACIIGAVLAGLFAPLWTLCLVAWLRDGFVELWRIRFPKKVEMPEARVHR